MNILKISSQYSIYTAKETPFRSEIMRYNNLEQTNTLFRVRIGIKTPVILRMLFAYMSPESIRTHGCSRISILISVILNSLLRILSHVFYSSHSAYYVLKTLYDAAADLEE